MRGDTHPQPAPGTGPAPGPGLAPPQGTLHFCARTRSKTDNNGMHARRKEPGGVDKWGGRRHGAKNHKFDSWEGSVWTPK